MKVCCTDRARRALRVSISSCVLLLGGCAEMSFKPGAGPGDFAAAEKSCRAAGAADYESCMNARGFMLHRRAESIFAGEGENGAAEDAAAPAGEVDAIAPVASVPAPAPAAGAPAAAADTSPRPAAGRPPPAPRGPVEVTSWWKLGGSAAQFDAARAACISELKEPPSATADPNVASPSLVACLKKAGWYGIAKSR
ncbi:MAG: hypothetical protein AB7O21_12150 [Gammaproteobacteria bacterium]